LSFLAFNFSLQHPIHGRTDGSFDSTVVLDFRYQYFSYFVLSLQHSIVAEEFDSTEYMHEYLYATLNFLFFSIFNSTINIIYSSGMKNKFQIKVTHMHSKLHVTTPD
jgi:hypothetical protein